MAFISSLDYLPCRIFKSTTVLACQTQSLQSATTLSRRTCLRRLSELTFVALTSACVDISTCEKVEASTRASNETIINSVLSAYGLPTLADKKGFTLLTQQYGRLVVQFQYPSSWVVARNVAPSSDPAEQRAAGDAQGMGFASSPLEGRASGLTAADYRRAEGVALFVSPVSSNVRTVQDVPASFVANLVTPGDATGVAPEVRVTHDSVDDEGYRVVDTIYESTTISGYTIERKARTRGIILPDRKLYVLNASCSAVRWRKMVDSLDTTLQSFRVFTL